MTGASSRAVRPFPYWAEPPLPAGPARSTIGTDKEPKVKLMTDEEQRLTTIEARLNLLVSLMPHIIGALPHEKATPIVQVLEDTAALWDYKNGQLPPSPSPSEESLHQTEQLARMYANNVRNRFQAAGTPLPSPEQHQLQTTEGLIDLPRRTGRDRP